MPTGHWVLSRRGTVVETLGHEWYRRVAAARFGWLRAEVPSDVSEFAGADVVVGVTPCGGVRHAAMICERGCEFPRMIAKVRAQGSWSNDPCRTATIERLDLPDTGRHIHCGVERHCHARADVGAGS